MPAERISDTLGAYTPVIESMLGKHCEHCQVSRSNRSGVLTPQDNTHPRLCPVVPLNIALGSCGCAAPAPVQLCFGGMLGCVLSRLILLAV